MAQDNKAVYVCESSAGFSFRVNETRYKFDKHQLIIEDSTEIKAFDACLAKYPTIGGKVKKVTAAAGEALVQHHKDTHGGAHSGPFSSSAMADLEAAKLDKAGVNVVAQNEADAEILTNAVIADANLANAENKPTAPVSTAPPALVEKTPAVNSFLKTKT